MFSAHARDLRCSNRFAGRAPFVCAALTVIILLKSQQKFVDAIYRRDAGAHPEGHAQKM